MNLSYKDALKEIKAKKAARREREVREIEKIAAPGCQSTLTARRAALGT